MWVSKVGGACSRTDGRGSPIATILTGPLSCSLSLKCGNVSSTRISFAGTLHCAPPKADGAQAIVATAKHPPDVASVAFVRGLNTASLRIYFPAGNRRRRRPAILLYQSIILAVMHKVQTPAH